MSYRSATLLSCAASLVVAANVYAASPPAENPSDAMPAAPVPIVPLPPAVIGAAASVGIVGVLRLTRHRRWITLR